MWIKRSNYDRLIDNLAHISVELVSTRYEISRLRNSYEELMVGNKAIINSINHNVRELVNLYSPAPLEHPVKCDVGYDNNNETTDINELIKQFIIEKRKHKLNKEGNEN